MTKSERDELRKLAEIGLEYSARFGRDALVEANPQTILKLLDLLDEAEKALLSADNHWFNPLKENFACIGCDLHCGRSDLGHDKDCCVNIAHEFLSKLRGGE